MQYINFQQYTYFQCFYLLQLNSQKKKKHRKLIYHIFLVITKTLGSKENAEINFLMQDIELKGFSENYIMFAISSK